MLKVVRTIMLVLLVMAIAGLGVTCIVRTQENLDRGAAAIASADDFLLKHEGGHR